MTYVRRYRLRVIAEPRVLVVQGPSRVVREALEPLGVRPLYSTPSAGYLVDRHKGDVDRTSDVLAALEAAGHRVQLVETSAEGGGSR